MDVKPFKKNRVYKRSEIHDNFGGSRQSGISTCAKYPFIFIFSGRRGERYGYFDEWLDTSESVFQYTGEGQEGDMEFVRGNLALRDHIENGKRVFLFKQTKRGYVRFVDEVQLFDVDYFKGVDKFGAVRNSIKFFFKRYYTSVGETSKTEYFEEDISQTNLILPAHTERKGLVTSRVGQGAYRKGLIYRWQGQCAVTGYDHNKVLVASHIVPWAESNHAERVDVDNGILLSPTYDALFDKKLISFGDDGEILLSEQLKHTSYKKLGVTGKEQITDLRERNYKYLERHRHQAGF